MLAGLFPPNPHRDAENTNNQWRNNLCLLPLLGVSSSKRKGNENECKHGDQQDDADQVHSPENFYQEPLCPVDLEKTLV